MQRCDQAAAQACLEQVAARHPTDRIAVRLLSFMCIAQGDYRGGLEIARRTLERAASLERYGHILWHLGEAQAILGHERLTRDYATAPTVPPFERIALMWRLEVVRGLQVNDAVWKELAAQGGR